MLLDIIITDNYSCESILHLRFKGFLYASETQSHVDMITMQLVFFVKHVFGSIICFGYEFDVIYFQNFRTVVLCQLKAFILMIGLYN